MSSLGDPLDLNFSARGNLYATHALHPFAARFPPPLARWAIERYSEPGDLVVDPMVGSGTTLVEAMLTGRSSIGIDIDPLARLVSRAKTTWCRPETLDQVARDIRSRVARTKRLRRPQDLPNIPDFDKWFRTDVAADLARLKRTIAGARTSPSLRQVLWAIFSSLIVARTPVANARDLVHSRHHYRKWKSDPNTIARFFRKLDRAALMMADFRERRVGVPKSRSEVKKGRAEHIPVEPGSVDLIVTSPPYCSALDYTRAHVFSVAWLADVLGISTDEYVDLGRQYIGSERAALRGTKRGEAPPSLHPSVDEIVHKLAEDRRRAWIVYRYFKSMGATMASCQKALRVGGHAVFVVCPSNIRRHPVPTHTIFGEICSSETGGALVVEDLLERTIHDHRRVLPYIEKSFGPRMRTEYVLVLKRAK